MSTFVLIHGAFHGGWCWDAVRAPLEAAGHTVVTPDLPGLGDDQTVREAIGPTSYVERVMDVVVEQQEPVILAGHSMAGAMISQTAERLPDRIDTLVYIAAWLLPNGSSSPAFYKELGVTSPVMACCDVSDDGFVTFRPEFLAEKLYNTSAPEAVEAIAPRLRAIIGAAVGVPLALTPENFGRVRRVYIETSQDEAIPQKYQQMMYSVVPCEQVITLDCDHCPMVSCPEVLTQHLLNCLTPA